MKEYFKINNHIFILVKKNDPTCKACTLNIIEGQICSNYNLLINNELKRKCCHFAYEEFKLVTDKKERLIALLSEDTKEIKLIKDETNLNYTEWLLKTLLESRS
ncbi:hypothetical protein [Cetobacterium sp.]|uniref:hypothetical protein n=1 Tax=Cetobacterium sp. TaxID=2071632 RepID=UPI003F33F14A